MRRTRHLSLLAATVWLASTATVVVASPASAATVGTTQARTEIASLVRSTYSGLPFGNVACPTTVKRATGVTFSCTVQLPGAFLVVDASQTDGSGTVELSTQQAVLTKSGLEALVNTNTSIPATVDCGPAAWLVRNPGDVVSCAAALSDGTTRTVQLTVRDTAGNVTITAVT